MHHEAGLRQLLERENIETDDQTLLIEGLKKNPGTVDLSPPDRAMIDYAVKLTLSPADIDAADIDALRVQGFNDRAIHDICAVTAYFAFVNRIADGLGVELEA